jgi:hypothetical protein
LTRKKGFDVSRELKAIARERVGRIPPAKLIQPKSLRKKPKHKKPAGEES